MDKSNGAFPVLDASLRSLPYFDGPCFSMFLGQLTRLQFGSGSVTVCLSFRMPPLPPCLSLPLCSVSAVTPRYRRKSSPNELGSDRALYKVLTDVPSVI